MSEVIEHAREIATENEALRIEANVGAGVFTVVIATALTACVCVFVIVPVVVLLCSGN